MFCKICGEDLNAMARAILSLKVLYNIEQYSDNPTVSRILYWDENYGDMEICPLCLENPVYRGAMFLGLLDDKERFDEYVKMWEGYSFTDEGDIIKNED
jgi:hypothetical protein